MVGNRDIVEKLEKRGNIPSVKSKLEFMAFDHNSFLGCYGSMTDLRGFKVNKP